MTFHCWSNSVPSTQITTSYIECRQRQRCSPYCCISLGKALNIHFNVWKYFRNSHEIAKRRWERVCCNRQPLSVEVGLFAPPSLPFWIYNHSQKRPCLLGQTQKTRCSFWPQMATIHSIFNLAGHRPHHLRVLSWPEQSEWTHEGRTKNKHIRR